MSINKIILFVALISAVLIGALFVTHLQHPSTVSGNNESLAFNVPRDIKDFELVSHQGQPFTQKDFLHHWTLVFFGFTHCAKICPTTLEMLKRVYPSLSKAYPTLQVVFISLDPERDLPKTISNYLASYNPEFIGASGKTSDLRKLQSQLGIFSARKGTSTDYQIQHTTSILLINPEGKWAGLFHYGLNPAQFKQAFIQNAKA